jgi:toxin ParE1/3/4
VADVIVSPQAEADLEEIWLTIALDNPKAADRVLRRISEKLNHLAQFPEMGVLRPDIATTARMLIAGSYLILYQSNNDDVEVVRVLHGARDLTDLL